MVLVAAVSVTPAYADDDPNMVKGAAKGAAIGAVTGVGAGTGAAVGAAAKRPTDTRITSYNVCYTKLLRRHIQTIMG